MYYPSIAAVSRAYNLLPISPSCKEKWHILLFPKVPGVFYLYLCFSTCPPLVNRGNQTKKKKVNIWTAAKDGREQPSWPARLWWVDQRPPPKPEQEEMFPAISNNDRRRQLSYRFDVCYMATRLGMSAKDGCLPQQHLIHVSSRLKGEQRLENGSQVQVSVMISHSEANQFYFPQIKFYI